MAGLLTRPSALWTAATSPLETVQAVLGRYHFVSFRLKRWDQFTEARTIRPKSMGEYNAWSITSRSELS